MNEQRKTDNALLDNMDRFRMSRALGHVYVYLTRPVFERYGMAGETAIRQALRAFGRYRGQRWRKWHQEEGLPLNLESFITFVDIDSTRGCGGYNPETIIDPCYVEFQTTHCPLHEVCRENDFEHWGYIYCDEMHFEIMKVYQPKAIIEIHENLMKRDPGCHFYLMMPSLTPEDEIDRTPLRALAERNEKDPVGFTRFMLHREGIQVGMLYYFLARAVIDRFGAEGRSLVTESLQGMGARMGREIKANLEKAGLQTSWEAIWNNFPLAYKYAWGMKPEETGDERVFLAEMTGCPLAEVWGEIGDKELGPLYCRTIYPAIFRELSPAAEISTPRCQSKGDTACRFEFRI
ncbi:MAG: L-2-amino-thiazoline-4-carboxylic acid hydrolase [Deltaproteobacteria bacterium]|nr:L-2-amino-thiazoline-4-carboxylic acid hydrolase [Deltaproteobacteria bacterium]